MRMALQDLAEIASSWTHYRMYQIYSVACPRYAISAKPCGDMPIDVRFIYLVVKALNTFEKGMVIISFFPGVIYEGFR